MAKNQWKFRVMSEYNYTRKDIPIEWQAWHEAYFDLVATSLAQPREYVRLIESGCTTDGGTPNCTRTCGNSTEMFSSPENLWNCISLATVTMAVVPGDDTFDPSGFEDIDKVFHIGSFEEFDKLFVFREVRECFWESCSDSRFGKCTPKLFNYRCGPIDQNNMREFGAIIKDSFCQDADRGIDSDIAGPGVLIAYIIQCGLAVLLGFSFKFTADRSQARAQGQPYKTITTRLKQRTCNSGFADFFHQLPNRYLPAALLKRTSNDFSDWLAARFAHAVHSTIFDLQEAQLLFVVTFSLLSLIAFMGGDVGLANMGSVFSYIVNRKIAHGLVLAGMYPVLLVQLYFHRASRRWRYALLLLLFNWILILVYYGVSDQADPRRFWQNLKETSVVQACGDNPGPMSYCQIQQEGELSDFFQATVHVDPVLHLAVGFLVLDWIFHTERLRSWLLQIEYLHRWLPPSVWPGIRDMLWAIIQLSVLVAMGIGLSDVWQALSKIYLSDGSRISWGFGQLVALAIWLPVIAKFFYFFSVGAKEGTNTRIHGDLEVHDARDSRLPDEGQDGQGTETQGLISNMSQLGTSEISEGWSHLEAKELHRGGRTGDV